MENLVDKLAKGKHAVVFESRTSDIKELHDRVNNGFIFITFTETRGGTELGINLEKELCNFSKADFDQSQGLIEIAGTCELNYKKVRCRAEVDLETRKGEGFLEILDRTIS